MILNRSVDLFHIAEGERRYLAIDTAFYGPLVEKIRNLGFALSSQSGYWLLSEEDAAADSCIEELKRSVIVHYHPHLLTLQLNGRRAVLNIFQR